MERRLTSILGDASYRTFVACDGDAIVGVVGTRSDQCRNRRSVWPNHGPGRLRRPRPTTASACCWSRATQSRFVERGAAVSIVTSANRRADAHAFYETHGYAFDEPPLQEGARPQPRVRRIAANIERLVDQLRRSAEGDTWRGPSVREVWKA